MATRRKSRSASGKSMLAAIPWWAFVVAALVAYLLLHRLSVMDIPHADDVMSFGRQAIVTFVRGYAMLLQVVIPGILLMLAVASIVERHRRKRLVSAAAGESAADVIRAMRWQDFEVLVSEAFRAQGYRVTETGGGGADGGVDLELRKDGSTILVQCKQWRAFKVPVNVVRETYGIVAAEGADAGLVVTSGVFTAEAVRFAEGRNIRLIDGPKLLALLGDAPAGSPTIPVSARPDTVKVAPACPRCGAQMRLRQARRGAHAGNEFWGCTAWPECRGIRAVE